jgi:hypothetical protein
MLRERAAAPPWLSPTQPRHITEGLFILFGVRSERQIRGADAMQDTVSSIAFRPKAEAPGDREMMD